jgi:hypothetical protein
MANQNAFEGQKKAERPVFGQTKIDTGLKKAALADVNSRLIVNTEKPHNGGR